MEGYVRTLDNPALKMPVDEMSVVEEVVYGITDYLFDRGDFGSVMPHGPNTTSTMHRYQIRTGHGSELDLTFSINYHFTEKRLEVIPENDKLTLQMLEDISDLLPK